MGTKDWIGNSKSVFSTLGASSHSETERELQDYYATDPNALRYLLDRENFSDVLEPACGEGHLSRVLVERGIHGRSLDLMDRGYGEQGDFFWMDKWRGDIITNPPYKIAQRFLEHSMDIISPGRRVALFLKLQFLEGQSRLEMYKKYPLQTLYVFSARVLCAKGGDFSQVKSSAVAYGWFIWAKGWDQSPEIKWIDNRGGYHEAQGLAEQAQRMREAEQRTQEEETDGN